MFKKTLCRAIVAGTALLSGASALAEGETTGSPITVDLSGANNALSGMESAVTTFVTGNLTMTIAKVVGLGLGIFLIFKVGRWVARALGR